MITGDAPVSGQPHHSSDPDRDAPWADRQIPLVGRRDFPGGGFVSVDELEPNNIFVVRGRSDREIVKIVDLGVSKIESRVIRRASRAVAAAPSR